MKQVIPTLAGIKDTIDSQTHLRSIVVRVKAAYPDFSVMAGIDDYLLGVLSVGGDGLIGGAPNYVPALFVDLYTAYQNKDFDRLMEDQKKVARLAGIAAESMPPVAAYKEATVAVLGRGSTYVRPPLGRVSPEGVGRIKAILAEIA